MGHPEHYHYTRRSVLNDTFGIAHHNRNHHYSLRRASNTINYARRNTPYATTSRSSQTLRKEVSGTRAHDSFYTRGAQGACQNTKPKCQDRKSTRLNSSHVAISYAVFC